MSSQYFDFPEAIWKQEAPNCNLESIVHAGLQRIFKEGDEPFAMSCFLSDKKSVQNFMIYTLFDISTIYTI
jgi:hypothetical protein